MIKKLLLLMLLSVSAFAQNPTGQRSFTATAVSADVGINNQGSGISYHKLVWTNAGTVSACTVALDKSSDGSSWTAGGIISGQDCSSNGYSSIVISTANYVRINVTAFTGTGSVTVIWDGWVVSPTSGNNTASFNWLTPSTSDSGKWQAFYAQAKTITRIYCSTDGLGTVTFNPEIRPETSPNSTGTSVLSAPITCTGTGTSTTTILNDTIPGSLGLLYIVTPVVTATSGSPGLVRIAVVTQ